MNESPLIHSSASTPPSRNKLSSPLVAVLRRARAPTRTASAPAADWTSAGLMMSGSSTDRIRSLETQLATRTAAAISAEPHHRRGMNRYGCTVISETKVEAKGHVARRRKGLERGGRVTGGAVRFGIHASVLGPEDTEIAHGTRDSERAAAEVAIGPAIRRVEGE